MTDKPIYRISSAGKCPRALSAEKLGYEPKEAPAWLETAANEGKLHEDWIVSQLESQGYNIGGRQAEMILDYPQFQLVGHIDGIAIKDNRQYLLEIKTMSHFEFQRWMKDTFLGFSTYADQVSLYWQALKQQMSVAGALYVVKNRSSGYIDQFIMPQPPSDFELVISKLIAVERAVAEGNLYEADFDPSSIECKRCNFRDQICLVSKEQLTEATEKALLEATEQVRQGRLLKAQGITLEEKGKETLSNHAEAISPDKKYFFDIGDTHTARFHVKATSYTVNKKEGWQTRITDLRKEEENGD